MSYSVSVSSCETLTAEQDKPIGTFQTRSGSQIISTETIQFVPKEENSQLFYR